MSYKLSSEFGFLEEVILHSPGFEIDRLTPENMQDLLFEDVPFFDLMLKEHHEFSSLIRITSNASVHKLHQLLYEVLRDEAVAASLLAKVVKGTTIEAMVEEIMSRFTRAQLVNALIGGLRYRELKRKFPTVNIPGVDEFDFILPPSPNSYFMRDPAAVVQSGVIISKMKYDGRQREAGIMDTIFRHHPHFKGQTQFMYEGESETESIEGGDIIIISPKALAIGVSERTSLEAVKKVAHNLFQNEQVSRVYAVHLPSKRNFMHLDTVFTIIDENLIVTYPEAIQTIDQTTVLFPEQRGNEVIIAEELRKRSLLDVLKDEIDYLEVIETGFGHPVYSSREQWYDGANVFAIGPRRVISYDRNKHTNRALREAGVEVFTTSSSELSRGLGGPRCMTMPIKRSEF